LTKHRHLDTILLAMKSPDPSLPRHPIGVVTHYTGLKRDLIRAWERRYGAVAPTRSDSGRRLYSDRDVERLRLLARVVAAGRNIGQVADLPDDELTELAAADRAAASELRAVTPVHGISVANGEAAVQLLGRCLDAVRDLDPRQLETLLEQASVTLSRLHVIERLLVPLMHRIGELWSDGDLGPAHEHMASTVVRTFIGGIQGAYRGSPGAPRLLSTTPAGQRHELGALVVAACASAEGWEATYLGADLPAEEIAAAARQAQARAVALSITYPADDPLLAGQLERLARLLPDGVRLLAGGRVADAYAGSLERCAARRIDSVAELRGELDRLRTLPAPAHAHQEPRRENTARGRTPLASARSAM
jgi:methanogenic corrinoid protein MtbC1